jgi:hypothetical protein
MKYSKEHEFILLAVRRQPNALAQPRLETLIQHGLDWEYVQYQTYVHRVGALIYQNCVRHPEHFPEMPPAVLQYLHELYQQTYLQNTLWYQEFDTVLGEFAKKGVTPVALKGIALARIVYRDIALRPMQDIDLLIQQPDLTVAAEMLYRLGYSHILDHLTYLSDWHKTYEARLYAALSSQGDHLPVFLKQSGSGFMCIELHHQLAPDMTAARVKTCTASDPTLPVPILAPEYFLVHLCFHLSTHAQDDKQPRLIWGCDIAEFLTMFRSRINWDSVSFISHQYQIEQPVRESLELVKQCLQEPFRETSGVTKFFRLSPASEEAALLQNMFRYGKRNGMRYLWALLFPSRKFLITRYSIRHQRLTPIFYLVRVFHALKRGVRLLKNMLIG